MAHFAEIDKDNKVARILVVPDSQENRGAEYLSEDLGLGGTWIQTSYNNKIRNKFAGVGDLYDSEKDVFITVPVIKRAGYLDMESDEWVWLDEIK